MVEETQKDKEVYTKLADILEREQSDKPVADEQKQIILAQLNEMANSSMDFDPDNLDKIIAFAQNYGNNTQAEVVLRKAKEQQAKALQEQSILDKQSQFVSPQFRQDVDFINQPSYDVFKTYQNLKGKKELTEEEKRQLAEIEKQAISVLSRVDADSIDSENAVALQDYLAIANEADLDEDTKKKCDHLKELVKAQLKTYDQENGLETFNLSAEEYAGNAQQWTQVAQHVDIASYMSELKAISQNLTPEEQKEMAGGLLRSTAYKLSNKSPDENGVEEYGKALTENIGEYKALVNAEYLKQQALAEFCEKNNINQQELNDILQGAAKGLSLSDEEKALKEQFEKHLTEYVAKFPDFKGPYENKQFLKNAVEMANATTISRQVALESRKARLSNAPSIPAQISKMNNNFALKHPKLYKGLNIAKTIGLNVAKTAVISAALGPVGLTAYSALKTAQAIRKSYKRYQEKEGGNFKDFIKYLGKRENRAEALTLAGQVAATAISGYFTLGGGFENMDLGMVGKAMGHTGGHVADAAAGAVQHADTFGGAVKAGFNKILSSPRRAATMASSLGIGAVKFLSEKSNQKYARKNLAKILEESGVQNVEDLAKQLEKCENKEQFVEKLGAYAQQMDAGKVNKAFEYAELARKSNPKAAFVAAVSGAAIGLTAAAASEYIHGLPFGQAEKAEGGHGVPEHSAETEVHTGVSEVSASWNNEANAAQRLESFGIDAKNANEMLREMGVISKDDHHFYRQHELANLVNNHPLNDEQKSQIQSWADDRDARVHNLKVWQNEHASHNTGHSSHNGVRGGLSGDVKDVSTPDNSEQTTTPEGETAEEVVEKQKYHIQGRIDKLKGLRGDVEATNPIEAARAFHQEQNLKLERSSKLTITDEDGDKTVLKTKIGRRSESTEITSYEGEEKVLSQKTKFYKTGAAQGASRTVVHTDVDGDGKNDKIVTTKSADGQTVTKTKLSTGGRTLEVTDAEGNSTKISTQEMVENGDSKAHANRVIRSTYRNISRVVKGRD